MELLNDILFWALAFFLVWNAYIILFHKGVPNIGTAPAIRKKVVEFLKEDFKARAKAPYIVYDMGSGDGSFTREIARNLPGARVIGIETSFQSYQWSMFLKKLFKLDNLDYRRQDFFSHDFSDAAAVVLYQTIFQMEGIGRKLNDNLKSGTFVASNRYPLGGGWVPSQSLEVKTLYPHQKALYIYKKA